MSKVAPFEDMLEDMKAGVYDFTKDGKCSNCGSCCSDLLPITQKEIDTIKKYIRTHGIKEQKRIVPAAVPVVDFTCPFRSDSQKKCLIYNIRPRICREFICSNPKNDKWCSETMKNSPVKIVSMRNTFFK